jgi:hypothetical protein
MDEEARNRGHDSLYHSSHGGRGGRGRLGPDSRLTSGRGDRWVAPSYGEGDDASTGDESKVVEQLYSSSKRMLDDQVVQPKKKGRTSVASRAASAGLTRAEIGGEDDTEAAIKLSLEDGGSKKKASKARKSKADDEKREPSFRAQYHGDDVSPDQKVSMLAAKEVLVAQELQLAGIPPVLGLGMDLDDKPTGMKECYEAKEGKGKALRNPRGAFVGNERTSMVAYANQFDISTMLFRRHTEVMNVAKLRAEKAKKEMQQNAIMLAQHKIAIANTVSGAPYTMRHDNDNIIAFNDTFDMLKDKLTQFNDCLSYTDGGVTQEARVYIPADAYGMLGVIALHMTFGAFNRELGCVYLSECIRCPRVQRLLANEKMVSDANKRAIWLAILSSIKSDYLTAVAILRNRTMHASGKSAADAIAVDWNSFDNDVVDAMKKRSVSLVKMEDYKDHLYVSGAMDSRVKIDRWEEGGIYAAKKNRIGSSNDPVPTDEHEGGAEARSSRVPPGDGNEDGTEVVSDLDGPTLILDQDEETLIDTQQSDRVAASAIDHQLLVDNFSRGIQRSVLTDRGTLFNIALSADETEMTNLHDGESQAGSGN